MTGNDSQLRICMPIFFYFPVIMGGAERQAERLATELVRRGNRVTIVTGWWDRKIPKVQLDGDIAIYRNTTLWEAFERLTPLRMLRHYAYEFSLGWYLWSRRNEYDIIHAHQALHAAVVATVVGRVAGKPVVIKVGCGGQFGDQQLMKGCQVSPLGRLFWRIIRKCHAIVAISGQIREELLSDGFPPAKVHSIANGISMHGRGVKVDYSLSSISGILSVGRLEPQKGFDVLVEALSLMEGPLTCSIFGEGRERDSLHGQVTANGLQAKCFFPGIVHDISDRLANADLFVLPSRAEGMSNALMEAMAAGLPCVATNVGGNHDLIDPTALAPARILPGEFHCCVNGVLVGTDDPVGLKNAFNFLLANESQRRRTGEFARKWISESVSIESVADRYLELYHELLQ